MVNANGNSYDYDHSDDDYDTCDDRMVITMMLARADGDANVSLPDYHNLVHATVLFPRGCMNRLE